MYDMKERQELNVIVYIPDRSRIREPTIKNVPGVDTPRPCRQWCRKHICFGWRQIWYSQNYLSLLIIFKVYGQ